MHFALSSDHRDFFYKNRFISFEDLLTSDQVDALQKEIDLVITKRLEAVPHPTNTRTGADVFRAGFDLWRGSSSIRKLAFKKHMAEIVSSLFHTAPLQIAFDQYFEGAIEERAAKETSSLEDSSCIKPLTGAFLLRLSDEPLELTHDQALCPIPAKKGDVIFLSPSLSIDWNLLFSLPKLHLYLVAYAPLKSMYYLEKKDPQTHHFKKLGYVFGDHIKDATHPIVFRS